MRTSAPRTYLGVSFSICAARVTIPEPSAICSRSARSAGERRSSSAEEVLWRPELQEEKRSENGMVNPRYAWGKKARVVSVFRELRDATLPGCESRYAF